MQIPLPAIAVNGVIGAQVSPLDRGFAYGDGVFETCKLCSGEIPLWNLHRERLIKSCARLFIRIDMVTLEAQLTNLLSAISKQDSKSAVVKITVTRGEGGRGYRPPQETSPTIVIGIFPGAIYPSHYFSVGVDIRLCDYRMSTNPHLAGLKHLNRLEQVLVRAEWNDESIAEGLVFDANNHLIEAVFSNVFLIKNNEVFTPDLSQAGVAGVMRRFILETAAPQNNIGINVKLLQREDVLDADALFLCNSLYGIWPVAQIVGECARSFPAHPMIEKLQRTVNETLASN